MSAERTLRHDTQIPHLWNACDYSGPRTHSELAENPPQVGADSPGANVEYPGDYLVRVSERDKPYDFLLARTELDIALYWFWKPDE
jgi:hypothetical protein